MKHRPTLTALALFAAANCATAAEKVGTATLIKTSVNGDYGEIVVRAPVHRDERIRTSKSGLGEFIFRDGTRFAIGEGSNVVIDKFVYDDSKTVQKFSVKVAKGTFRWVSGNSKSSAYEIRTPAGTIGVRGTKFDFYVGADGTTALVLLNGAARFCGSGQCVQLQRQCDCVIAAPGSPPSRSRASRRTLTALGNARALPFLSGDQTLSRSFGASSGCGMALALNNIEPKARARTAPNKPTPNKPTPEKPTPNKPTPEKPTPKKPTPEKPSTPDRPEPKGGHGYGDKNHDHVHKNH